jgi:hypothetical protein
MRLIRLTAFQVDATIQQLSKLQDLTPQTHCIKRWACTHLDLLKQFKRETVQRQTPLVQLSTLLEQQPKAHQITWKYLVHQVTASALIVHQAAALRPADASQ